MTDTLDQSPDIKSLAPPKGLKKRRAQNVAEWVASVDFKDLDQQTVEFTEALLLKTIAGMLAGCREPAARILTTYYAEQGGAPDAGVVGAGYRTTVENAAFANATFAHSSELEDNEMPNFTSAYRRASSGDIPLRRVVVALLRNRRLALLRGHCDLDRQNV